jgi:hypothetical protein
VYPVPALEVPSKDPEEVTTVTTGVEEEELVVVKEEEEPVSVVAVRLLGLMKAGAVVLHFGQYPAPVPIGMQVES